MQMRTGWRAAFPAPSSNPAVPELSITPTRAKAAWAGHPALIALALMLALILAGCGGAHVRQAQATSPGDSPAGGASAATTSTTPTGSTPATAVPAAGHVFVVIEENHSFGEVMAQMPWLVAKAKANGITANYYSNDGGSALDYFWLSSGSNEEQYGCGGWGCPRPILSDNIYRELDARGMNWKIYAQGLPSAGDMRQTDLGSYAVRHNPAIWYEDVIHAGAAYQKRHIVPDTQLAADIAAKSLPSFAFIVPDVDHDAHNGTLAQADAYLQKVVAPLLKSSAFQPGGDGLLFLTFDECGGGTNDGCGGHVFTAVIGPDVVARTVSNTLYRHQDTLRTVLDALGVHNYPGASSTANDMTDFFRH
jgi:acid phosphatase